MKRAPVKTLCAVGWYDPEGARHWVVRKGLTESGFSVIDAPVNGKGLLSKYRKIWRELRHRRKNFDAILVPFQGHYAVPVAWLFGKIHRKPVVFDVFISLHDSMVSDRGLIKDKTPMAYLQKIIDRLSCSMADVLLIDTTEHAQFFADTYGVKFQKFVVIPIGCKQEIFKPITPKPKKNDDFEVFFHGTFIPLQGIDVIINAAAILRDNNVRFTLVGKGQTLNDMKKLAESLHLTNVSFEGPVPMQELPEHIANADVCLGIFGNSQKARRVIPHKAYEIIACAKPLITGRSPSSEAFFTDKENAVLCEMNNPEALAEAIMLLRDDALLRKKIAENGYQLFLEKCAPRTIVSALVERINLL